jgi:hypothetical protein
MKEKVILDLCGGTGAWSRPYKEAGYDVRVITLPEYDVTKYYHNEENISFNGNDWIKLNDVYGVLAAPPCTMFSDARTNAIMPRDLELGMKVVKACLDIIYILQYNTKSDQQKYPPLKFWVLENPWYGKLKWFLGKPNFEFSPYEFGDNYKKRTALWGHFNEPKKNPIEMTKEMIEKCKTNSRPLPKFDYMKSKDIHPEYYKKFDRQTRRAITPQGFAKAFYEANR